MKKKMSPQTKIAVILFLLGVVTAALMALLKNGVLK
jgi:LPS O-antigen subunit length determinant protein (WzzB/FepE family)